MLVLLTMLLHFRRLRYVLYSCVPALLGVLLSLLLARYALGYLNANTAFLIAIILGNGINTPIVLLSRYGEGLRGGLTQIESLRSGVKGALGSTLSAALAASIAYGTLLGTDLRLSLIHISSFPSQSARNPPSRFRRSSSGSSATTE